MNDIYVTLTGNIVAEPRQHQFRDGSRVTSLRVATTSRYFDRKTQEWCDGERTFFSVRCFRGLADNVAQSVRAGQPVVVHGRLRFREFEHKGERRVMPEVEASAVGHDLRWGLGTFTKPHRRVSHHDAHTRDLHDDPEAARGDASPDHSTRSRDVVIRHAEATGVEDGSVDAGTHDHVAGRAEIVDVVEAEVGDDSPMSLDDRIAA